MKLTHYQVLARTEIKAFEHEDWPQWTESTYPKIGEQVQTSTGFFLTVTAVRHKVEREAAGNVHVIEIQLDSEVRVT